jgi:mRNA interferase MazF
MRFEFGDVVLIPFPFTSHTASKRRPAVIFSNAAYARARPCDRDGDHRPAVSALSPGDVAVGLWREAGLLGTSAIKPVMAMLEQTLALRELGRLSEEDRVSLRAMLASILG